MNEKYASPDADKFLKYVTEKYPDPTYWLSTHCWKGENRYIDVLAPHLKDDTVKLLEKVEAISWVAT